MLKMCLAEEAPWQRCSVRTQESDHSQAAMLQLGGLQVKGALVGAGGQAQGVEHAAGVLAPLDVLLCVAVDLRAAHQQHLDDGQLPAASQAYGCKHRSMPLSVSQLGSSVVTRYATWLTARSHTG